MTSRWAPRAAPVTWWGRARALASCAGSFPASAGRAVTRPVSSLSGVPPEPEHAASAPASAAPHRARDCKAIAGVLAFSTAAVNRGSMTWMQGVDALETLATSPWAYVAAFVLGTLWG